MRNLLIGLGVGDGKPGQFRKTILTIPWMGLVGDTYENHVDYRRCRQVTGRL